jgi:hypothetical protein
LLDIAGQDIFLPPHKKCTADEGAVRPFPHLVGITIEDEFALQARVVGFINCRHAALAELLEDVVSSERLTDEITHSCSLFLNFPDLYIIHLGKDARGCKNH